MNSVEIDLIQSSIDNGRIYFSRSDVSFFPKDALSERAADDSSTRTVTFIAGPFTFETTIRKSSNVRLSPRKTFAPYLKSVRAEAGDRLRIEKRADREYIVEYLGR
jgi:hypothetical protein